MGGMCMGCVHSRPPRPCPVCAYVDDGSAPDIRWPEQPPPDKIQNSNRIPSTDP